MDRCSTNINQIVKYISSIFLLIHMHNGSRWCSTCLFHDAMHGCYRCVSWPIGLHPIGSLKTRGCQFTCFNIFWHQPRSVEPNFGAKTQRVWWKKIFTKTSSA